MAAATVCVSFCVDCRATAPGQVAFVVGGADALGKWEPKNGVPLTTNQATFPWWSSEPVVLPAGKPVEFKFVVVNESDKSPVLWETLSGNRSVEAAPGSKIMVRCTWDDRPNNVVVTSAAKGQPEQSPTSFVPEGGALRKTASACAFTTTEMETLKGSMTERDPMKRNFSQSLLGADGAPGAGSLPTEQSTPAASPTAGDERKSVSLKHIMSFSALTDMADTETKDKAWQKHKREYEPFNVDVPVVIVTSEIAPWSKSGGLGLVAASYGEQFARNGHRTMAISPKYQHYDGITCIGETCVNVNGHDELVKYWHKYIEYGENNGCDYVFVDHPSIERPGGLYNGQDGSEYKDNLFRFTLLSNAAMEAPLILEIGGRPYGDKVVFIANDWQSGLVPVYLCYKYRRHNCYMQARCIYAVHNLGYQGMYPHVDACHFFGVDRGAATDLALKDCINLTKAALICADRVITVSPNYANEIQSAAGGFGLDGYVRGKAHGLRLSGILNGIDDVWNPEIDQKIPKNFSVADFEAGKSFNKAELQRRLGLTEDGGCVMIGFVGRLTWQKGVDVLAECIEWLMEDVGNGVNGRAQLIMMGQGEEKYASALRWAENTFPGRACGYVGFDPAVEHAMMGGCDLFLMPSRYEPCGLPQMYAQRYGTLPVVHATGGLVDSVKDVSCGLEVATGFHIPYMSADKMKEVLYKAMEMYLKRPGEFKQMQRNAMEEDYYWPKAMDEYERNIDWTLHDPANVR